VTLGVALMAVAVVVASRVSLPSGVSAAAQTRASTPAAPVFDSSRAWEHLRKQVGFGPRPAGSPALAETRRYIIDQLKAVGLTAEQQTFVAKTPAGDISMTNIIARIPGRRRERIILASHYDTKRATNFRFVGASDGASSTAVLLELARVLAAQRRTLTIELLFLDGEEAVNWDWGTTGVDNTYGSRHYVEAAKKAGTLTSVKALVLLDMVGDRNLLIRRDLKSTPWLVDIVWSTAARLGHANVFSKETTEVDDDHIAFMRAGVPSVDIIDLDYPEWHTAQDDLDHVSARSLQTVGDVVVAAIAAIEKRVASN
jgi:Zn-dependent M28 family amino/carboxypeptidase